MSRVGREEERAERTSRNAGTRVAQYTFRFHKSYGISEGLYSAVAVNAGALAYIGIRRFSDLGFDHELFSTMIVWLPSVAILFAPLWGTSGKGRKAYLQFAAYVGRVLPFACIPFVSSPWHLVAVLTFASFICSGVPAATNALFGRNYQREERERYYGRVKMWLIPAYILSNVTFMVLMDVSEYTFLVGLPLAALAGAFGLLGFRKAKQRRLVVADALVPAPIPSLVKFSPLAPVRLVMRPFASSVDLMKRDRDFAIYELAFMVYGMAFMMLLPVVPVFYDRVYDISYAGFSLHTVVAFFGMQFLTHLVLRGRHSKWSAPGIATVAFSTVACYPAFLLLSSFIAPVSEVAGLVVALTGFAIFGVGMAFLDYAWGLGPVRFARGRDALPYTATHVMLVGVRALVAFPIALLLMKVMPDRFILSIGIPFLLFLVASTIVLVLRRQMRERQV